MIIKIPTVNIPIRKKPAVIVVTKFETGYVNYHLHDLTTVNKHVDIGVWRIKYKLSIN